MPTKLFERITRFSASKASLWVAFLWGFFEGIFFFIVPDVFLGFIALFHKRNGLIGSIIAMLGSLASGTLMYLLTIARGAGMLEFIRHVPLVTSEMIIRVQHSFSEQGAIALVTAPWNGIPYKIYPVQAALSGIGLTGVLLWSIISRLERVLPLVFVAIFLGSVFKRSIQKKTACWVLGYVILCIAIYTVYVLHIYR